MWHEVLQHVLVLADDSKDDPWSQRLTAGAAFITALFGGLGTMAAFMRSGRRRTDDAMRDAQQPDRPPVVMDDEQMRRVMETIMNERTQKPNETPEKKTL